MYKETDETSPINYYGVTKLEAEASVKALADEWCIARPSAIYGSTHTAWKVNFALWILERLEKGESISIITDQNISPTLNTNLAEMILEVAEEKITGVIHLAGATAINRYDFARLIAETFNMNKNLIKPAKAEEMDWKAQRPKNTSLNVEKASKILRSKPLRLEEALNGLKEEMNYLR
jgi:dTDP-4-dehydrorhamnose reductase